LETASAKTLKIQAPMATLVLARGTPDLVPSKSASDWKTWVNAYMETAERSGRRLIEAGFSVRQAVVLLSTVYTFTMSFVIEEQAVFPMKGKRSPAYDLPKRNANLDSRKFPILRRSGAILFDRFEQRYKESLGLIVGGVSLPKM
jgi:TetR/AcrR family tetracycline transcriptional repressor